MLARKQGRNAGELSLAVAFSGGGTRAAALSYGVLLELRDTQVRIDGRDKRLLDAIGLISSVSGGSFTSAYYGLYGDRIFQDFEERFLRRDIEGALLRGLFDPLRWFSGRGRTEMAVDYYRDVLFGDATFADLMRPDGPMVLINTSDLGRGVRFTFLQEYFNLLCSDLSSFSLARAVAASSAVPMIFDPVVVENYAGCAKGLPPWLMEARRRAGSNPDLRMVVDDDSAYSDKVGHAMLEAVEVVGGAKDYLQALQIQPAQRIAVIAVNAAASTRQGIDASVLQPTIEQTLNAVTNIQLHRYNTDTLQDMQLSMARWTQQLSTAQQPVHSFFIRLSFEDVPDLPLRRFLNEIPTSLALSEDQVDQLIAAGRALLRTNPEFRRLVASLDGRLATVPVTSR
ncbi:MAG: patatin-like phospholipase family protein [Burkholderiaceae bacterium]|nr:patatin-like phospholipase family protein [Burkholderiaceae bacterium]